MPEFSSKLKMNLSDGFPYIGKLLDAYDLHLKKGRGQHFLRHQEICRKIAEAATGGDENVNVIEVGAGLGNLSFELAGLAENVYSFEPDATFRDWHETLQESCGNLRIIPGDFLKVNLSEFLEDKESLAPWVGCGNLPYQITSDILFRFINSGIRFERLVFMVQKEVAERICSGVGTRQSGALTVKIALSYQAKVLFTVAPGSFIPPPKVNSAVFELTPLEKPYFQTKEERQRLYRLIDGLFQYRRKTLLNGLSQSGLVPEKSFASEALEKAQLTENLRPENLGLEDFIKLEEALRTS